MRFKWTVWSPRRLGRTGGTPRPGNARIRKQPPPANHDIRVTRCTYRDVSSPQFARGPRMLRYSADRRTLAYLAITAALTAVNWKTGSLHPVLYPVTLFMFFTSAVISHHHNHLGMWRSQTLN